MSLMTNILLLIYLGVFLDKVSPYKLVFEPEGVDLEDSGLSVEDSGLTDDDSEDLGIFDKAGFSCNGHEQGGGHGKGPRTLHITCSKQVPDENQKKKGKKGKVPMKTITYHCYYKGNPHNCAWYNNGNQMKFYEELTKEAIQNANGKCTEDELSYKKCKNVEFKKIGEKQKIRIKEIEITEF